ncbi:MAG: hypothetical protein QXP57_01900 [Nitrososphaerota archaeon]
MNQVERYLMYIGGEWVEASSKEYLGVKNPATEEVFAEVPSAGAEDVDQASKPLIRHSRSGLRHRWMSVEVFFAEQLT